MRSTSETQGGTSPGEAGAASRGCEVRGDGALGHGDQEGEEWECGENGMWRDFSY